MGRPRKRAVFSAPQLLEKGPREQYLEGLRKRLELFDAKEAAALLGVSQDRLYELRIPCFEPTERRTRWDAYSLADYLERGMAGAGSQSSYIRDVSAHGPLTATKVAAIIGLHSDVVPFLGLRPDEWTAGGRTLYKSESLADWLRDKAVVAAHD